MKYENITLNQVKVQLFQDEDERWGWTNGSYTVPATYTSRAIALMDAKRFIAKK